MEVYAHRVTCLLVFPLQRVYSIVVKLCERFTYLRTTLFSGMAMVPFLGLVMRCAGSANFQRVAREHRGHCGGHTEFHVPVPQSHIFLPLTVTGSPWAIHPAFCPGSCWLLK